MTIRVQTCTQAEWERLGHPDDAVVTLPLLLSPSFAVSPVDRRSKVTHDCRTCVAVILAEKGEEKSEVPRLNTLIHADPGSIILPSLAFYGALGRAADVLTRASTGELEAGIAGGRLGHTSPEIMHRLSRNFSMEYQTIRGMLSREIRKLLGVELCMLHPPKEVQGRTDVRYDARRHSVAVMQERQVSAD